MYTSFVSAKEDTVRELLRYVELGVYKGKVSLGVCFITQEGRTDTHIMPIHVLGILLMFEEYVSKALVYDLAFYKGLGQAPISLLVEPSWILGAGNQVNVSNMVMVVQAIREKKTEAERVALAMGTSAERVRAPLVIYIPRCLTSVLIIESRSLRMAWKIFWDRA